MGQVIIFLIIVLVASQWPKPLLWVAFIIGCLYVGGRFIIVAFPYLIAAFLLYLIWYGLFGNKKETNGNQSEDKKGD